MRTQISFRHVVIIIALCLGCLATLRVAAEDKPKETVAQRLDRLERLLSSRGLLDMLQQIQQLQDEVRQLRGQIEVQDHKLEQLSERQRNLYADVDQRLRQLQHKGGAATPSTGAAPPSGAAGGPPLTSLSPVPGAPGTATGGAGDNLMTTDVSNTPAAAPTRDSRMAMREERPGQKLTGSDIQPAGVEHAGGVSEAQIQARYQDAFKLLKQSRYDQAIHAFQTFLAAYPDSDYADNAQYWLAEAYYVTRDFPSALREYQKLVKNYPNSQKYTHGMLKIAYTLQELGRVDEAKKQLQDLIKNYPNSTATRLAEERLQRINASAAAAPAPAEQ
jgi:tol-pal system protein YbgF